MASATSSGRCLGASCCRRMRDSSSPRAPARKASTTWLRSDADRQRGEFVLIVEPADVADEEATLDWERTLATLLAELPLAQAVKLACRLTGAKKNAVYERALQISRGTITGRS